MIVLGSSTSVDLIAIGQGGNVRLAAARDLKAVSQGGRYTLDVATGGNTRVQTLPRAAPVDTTAWF